jgi:hypothetical protein
MEMKCKADGVDRAAAMILETLAPADAKKTIRPATMCYNVMRSLILRDDPECDMTKGVFTK